MANDILANLPESRALSEDASAENKEAMEAQLND